MGARAAGARISGGADTLRISGDKSLTRQAWTTRRVVKGSNGKRPLLPKPESVGQADAFQGRGPN
jgi:hypothetical protein